MILSFHLEFIYDIHAKWVEHMLGLLLVAGIQVARIVRVCVKRLRKMFEIIIN